MKITIRNGKIAKAELSGKRRDPWIIKFTDSGAREEGIVSYRNREEAIKAAVDFVGTEAKNELDRFEWEPDDEAPTLLKEILKSISNKKHDEAIVSWLEYQSNFDPEEKIAIGPSGSVSDSPWDFSPRKASTSLEGTKSKFTPADKINPWKNDGRKA